jgi:hypothetical protein
MPAPTVTLVLSEPANRREDDGLCDGDDAADEKDARRSLFSSGDDSVHVDPLKAAFLWVACVWIVYWPRPMRLPSGSWQPRSEAALPSRHGSHFGQEEGCAHRA